MAYQHPRSSGARITSAPLLDDGWMDFAAYGNTDDNVGAIEHQLYAVPSVNLQIGGADAATARHRLWNADHGRPVRDARRRAAARTRRR